MPSCIELAGLAMLAQRSQLIILWQEELKLSGRMPLAEPPVLSRVVVVSYGPRFVMSVNSVQ